MNELEILTQILDQPSKDMSFSLLEGYKRTLKPCKWRLLHNLVVKYYKLRDRVAGRMK